MRRPWSNGVALLLVAPLFTGILQDPDDATLLVRQLGQFPAAIDARIQSDTGLPSLQGMRIAQRPALDLEVFLPQLLGALRDSDERVKGLAAQAVAHLGADAAAAVPDLIRMLGDPNVGLRNSACIGLAGIGPAARDALPDLQRALSDPSNDVRRFAQRAIERNRAKARPALTDWGSLDAY